MQSLAQLAHEHAALDDAVAQLEALLQRPAAARTGKLRAVLNAVIGQLTDHLHFEERAFYRPLQAAGHARSGLVTRLLLEHQDLRQTLEQLRPLLRQPRPSQDAAFLIYGSHLIDLYREHSEQEDRWLFPLLEQLPLREALPADRSVGNCANSCYSERVAREHCKTTARATTDRNGEGGPVTRGHEGHAPWH